MTLSRDPGLRQSLPAKKQNELENGPESVAMGEESESLALDPTTRGRRRELYRQKRKLIFDELREFQKHQPRKLSFKADKRDQTGRHHTRFPRICGLMPIHHCLVAGLVIIAPIRSKEGRVVLSNMVEFYQQETGVAFRPDSEPEKVLLPGTA